MKEILTKFKNQKKEYRLRTREIDEEYEKITEEIKALTDRQTILLKTRQYLINPSKVSILHDIAAKIADHFKTSFEVHGPFGFLGVTTIYFIKNPKKPIAEQEFMYLSLCSDDKNVNWFEYDTGKETNEFIKGSSEYYMGLNHVFAPLPMDFDEVIKIVEATKS